MLVINPIYLLLIIPVFLGWFAQWRVRQSYQKYMKVSNKKGIKGSEVAKALFSHHKLNIPILLTKRPMLNYYNPQGKTLHLSEKIAEHDSITSISIVAHEVEHALQDKQGCKYMVMRNRMAKSLAIMGQFSPLIFMWGIFFRNAIFIYLGIILLFGMAIFALISLPVELNASKRALQTLKKLEIADKEEIKMVATVLRDASLTYFVGAGQRIATFLFIVMILFMAHQI
jgi:Zn-dependent membrane protease YugP